MGYLFDALNRPNENDRPGDPSSQAGRAAGDAANHQELAAAQPPDAQTGHTKAPPETPAVDETQAGPFHFENQAAATPESQPDPTQPGDPSTDDRMVALTEPTSVMAEEYRSIRTSILARWQQKRHLVHTITSATPQEGKTITTLNLGYSFAELRNRRIAVLEADLRLPLFAKMISLPPTPGLVGLLEGEAQLSDVLYRTVEDRLHIIPAGRRVNNMRAVQLLSTPTMASLIQQLRSTYDHVIIDTPPVIELADAGVLGSLSDEVLLIARMNRTPRELIEQAIRTLTSYNAPLGGVIATDQHRAKRRYYYYKYGYRYGSGYRYTYYKNKAQKAA